MKIVTRKIGLILRLGMTAVVLLLGQQAMAVGLASLGLNGGHRMA